MLINRFHSNHIPFYKPLFKTLEIQPLPTVKEGVIAFAIANKRPLDATESLELVVAFPDEWTDIPDKLGRDMSISEILDVVWPADSTHGL